MIKIPIKIEGKKYFIPQQWSHITTKQYCDLRKIDLKDDVSILSILLDIDYAIIYNTRQNDVDEKVAPYLKFLNRPFTGINMPPVNHLMIGGMSFDVPKDISLLTLGQKIDARNKMIEAFKTTNDVYPCISDIVAIYMQPIVQGKDYNHDDAISFARKVIDNCSITETYFIATFFLSKLTQYKIKNQLPYPLNLIRNKYLRAYWDLVYSRKSQQSTLLQEATFLNGT